MATYKVIQDIEAEDKLLGPLTLRQFIYAAVCVLLLYLTYLVSSKGAPFAAILFLPVAAASGFFAWPWGSDQPTEVWALAKIRFLFKPRRRLWDQSGAKQLVTVTAPKKVEAVFTNGLSQNEVHSRLETLASTIDSRGWAIKNVNVNMFAQPQQVLEVDDSDRLINPTNIPQYVAVSDDDIRADDDILDEQNNPRARQMDFMIEAAAKAHRAQIVQQLQAPAVPIQATPQTTPQSGQWFARPVAIPSTQTITTTAPTAIIQPQTLPASQAYYQPAAPQQQVSSTVVPVDENSLIATLRAQDEAKIRANAYSHLHTLQPLSATSQTPVPPSPPVPAQTPQPAVTPRPNAAILQLARNDDLNVATIAREAKKRSDSQDEVVISLH